MTTQHRNNVHCHGNGPVSMVFLHGYGCDQTMWRLLTPSFAPHFRVITFDLVGSGESDLAAYDKARYSSLHAYAEDLLEVIDEFAGGPVIFVGHSVSATIGMLATIRAPEKFLAQVMVGPSACYINDGDYVGGYNPEDIDGLLKLMEENYVDWTHTLVAAITGTSPDTALARELQTRFEHNDPDIARHFARVTFTADHRADVPHSSVPALILQCSDDLIAPREVGEYLHKHLPHNQLEIIDNTGHCPHLSAPTASSHFIDAFLARLGLGPGLA